MAAETASAPVPAQEIVDLAFSVVGQRVPADHGYALYGALCRRLPEVHSAGWLAVHPLRGQRLVSGLLRLSPMAQLVLRLPATQLPRVLGLAGTELAIQGHSLRIGVPTVRPLVPAPSLDARLVLIRITGEVRAPGGPLPKDQLEGRFRAELQRQLARLGAGAALVELCGRQEIRVAEKRLVGWTVRLGGLSEEASLAVQANGLGGKRAMGCGVFVPTRQEGTRG